MTGKGHLDTNGKAVHSMNLFGRKLVHHDSVINDSLKSTKKYPKWSFMNNREKGSKGEELASQHLLCKGYTIISTNYRNKFGEIDIIAKDVDGTIVFVEVKSSYDLKYGHPFHRVNRAKQRTIAKMAQLYFYEHKFQVACRFDAIAIVGNSVEHLKNAFLV